MNSYICNKCGRKDCLDPMHGPYKCPNDGTILEEYFPADYETANMSPMLDFSKGGAGFYANDKDAIRLGTDLKQWQWRNGRWHKTI